MIDLYTWPTPNGHKVHIMLEEVGLPYTVHAIDIHKGDQFDADFLRFSPNNKMPAIIDQDGPGGEPYEVFESGAILMYLAQKTGRFLPQDMRERYTVIQWLMFQMGGIGPMLGQAHHFLGYAPEKIRYAMDRYSKEANRLYAVVDRRLADHEYLAGAHYTIADMAAWPWMRRPERQGVERDDYPNFKRWFEVVEARPAVARGVQVLAEHQSTGVLSDEARRNMFGDAQYARR